MDTEIFHEKLNAILDEPGMSLKKLSEISGIPYKTLTNIRSAKSMPDRDNYMKLAFALGMSISDFSNSTVDEILDKSRNYRIITMINDMDGYQKKLACAMLETISSVKV